MVKVLKDLPVFLGGDRKAKRNAPVSASGGRAGLQ